MKPAQRRVFVPMFMFILVCAAVARSPRIAEMRAVDVVLIFAAGVCFGSALGGFIQSRKEGLNIAE